MEQDFEFAILSNQRVDGMLSTLEGALMESYGEGRRLDRSSPLKNDDHYLIFDTAGDGPNFRTELDELPTKMQNPFINMRRWLKFELLDLGAMLEAIHKKNEMDKRRREKIRKRNADKIELQNYREGTTPIFSIANLRTKDSKISRITELTNRIINNEKDIECLSLLHKIVVLQLN